MFESSKLNPEQTLTYRQIIILLCTAIFAAFLYLGMCLFVFRIGFPLDDAWIHQTYARNLALNHQWSFYPGIVSGGSTSPLWTALLAIGFLMGLSPLAWGYICGFTCILFIGILAELFFRNTLPVYRSAIPWVGCIFMFEWHLTWAAFSGMETIIYILCILIVFILLLAGSKKYLLLGILIGISIWIRPDGLLLLLPAFLSILFKHEQSNEKIRNFFSSLFGFSIFFLPYLLFNLVISGTPWPNTFYAKQAEYVNWQNSPIITRIFYFSLQFFQGINLLFIPGFIKNLYRSITGRKWEIIFIYAWLIGYAGIYIARLPVYQHGRYEMPALAVFLLLGFPGFIEDVNYFFVSKAKILKTMYFFVFIVILAISTIFGAYTFSADTALIESQMVDTAKWVSVNIPLNETIAAHDIGALGFYGNHQIVDLAGLVSPEIVPIMNDDHKILSYLDEKKVRYLAAFINWRPLLTSTSDKIFIISDIRFLQNTSNSMAVFQRNAP
ncbi:MAG: hypothetical protein WCP19_00465 [Chloroflexota bacterium]